MLTKWNLDLNIGTVACNVEKELTYRTNSKMEPILGTGICDEVWDRNQWKTGTKFGISLRSARIEPQIRPKMGTGYE